MIAQLLEISRTGDNVIKSGKALLAIVLFMCSSYGLLFAQDTIGDTDIEVYTLNGSIGMQGHAYTTTQDFNRREPLGALTTINLDYSFLGFTSGLDVRYSTDDNRLRQSMNRFSFYGSWRWLTLNAGDVNPAYTDYSLRGTMIRGGEIIIDPDNFSLELTAGRVNRMTSSSNGQLPRDFSYERWLYAASIGIGDSNRSNFKFTAMYGKDDTGTIPDTLGLNLPATGALPPPAENVALTPEFQLSLFEETFKIGAQTTFTAYTRDTNSPAISADDAGVPSFFTDIFTPRNSTRLTYAGRAHSELAFDPFQLHLEFERIQPGFESMGLRQIRDDKQTITASPRFQLLDNRISLDATYSISEDNLLGNRLSTQENEDIILNANFQLTDMINLGAGYNRFTSETFSESDDQTTTNGHRQLSQVFQLFPGISFIRGSTSHSISLSGVYQLMESEFPTSNGSEIQESNNFSGTANYSIALQTGLTVNTTLNLVEGEAPNSEFSTYGANAGVGYSFFDGDLNVNVTAGVSYNHNESNSAMEPIVNENFQVNGNITASYRITSGSSLQMNLRSQNNSIIEGAGQNFSEMEGRIEFRHRF